MYYLTFCLASDNFSNEKRSEATQTLRAGCSEAYPQTNKQTHRGDNYTAQLSA